MLCVNRVHTCYDDWQLSFEIKSGLVWLLTFPYQHDNRKHSIKNGTQNTSIQEVKIQKNPCNISLPQGDGEIQSWIYLGRKKGLQPNRQLDVQLRKKHRQRV